MIMGQHILRLSTEQRRMYCLASLLLMSLMFGRPASAAVEPADAAEPETEQESIDTNQPAKTVNSASVAAGYHFITPDGATVAAAPFERLKSGAIGSFSAATLGSDLKLKVDGMFIHEDDYQSELAFDYGGFVRLQASCEALWHNLLREKVDPGSLIGLNELDPGVTYGIRTTTTQARTRIKLGNNPFHLNLGYWELRREGNDQLRFSDHYWSGGTIITDANRVDRVTREGSVGLDAHLGFVDFSYGFRLRDFSNREDAPRYNFTNDAFGALVPGNHAHNTIPDSRVTSHTFKLFSDMSGGLVGSAVYTLTERENMGGQGEAVPSRRPSDLIHLAAGDISYTPSKLYSFALKYRHQEIEHTTPTSLLYPFIATPLTVHPAPSTYRDVVTASAIFRPYPKMIYRLEYSAELESRDNVLNAQSPDIPAGGVHSDTRLTHTGKTSFYWRPTNGVKVNASYSYATCDNPAYRASFSDRHVGKLLLTYVDAGKWGVTSSYLIQHDNGESSAWVLPPSDLVVSTGNTASLHALPRRSRSNSANASLWFSPLERLTITTSYSFLQSKIDQTALLTNISRNALAATRYLSTSHMYGINANYAATEQLDLSLALQQVFSKENYHVPLISPFTATNTSGEVTNYSSTGITRLSRLDTTETGFSARADWRVTSHLGCVLDYSFRVYNSGYEIYDGSVHTTMVSLKARW